MVETVASGPGESVFGFLSEGSRKSVYGHEVSISTTGDSHVYERTDSSGNVVNRTLLAPGVRVMVAPYPPFLLPLHGRLNCLYMRLRSPVVVPPGDHFRVEVGIPFDIAVIASSKGRHTLIDYFPPGGVTPKMAVYGSNVEGMLCRFWREEWEGPAANTRLTVVNNADVQATVSRVVIPRRGLSMFYNPVNGDIAASPIRMSVRDIDSADVWAEEPEPGEGFIEVPLVERDRRLFEALGPLVPSRISMIWGI
ncbi:DUF432 domain-containing protein [Aeropyrum camini]|uniref:Uncharacterized conserved protein n=1 Tax=Aeropyrum camini SY1 = JCM 12091 TaxID=1198449 RepID=U3TAV7_9CREN|nr:DUF432 domain-containing protein [Aeropyrum camini]BAN90642.1 uncharacterized conserved protein [Aeropyrum camini SY1 = JCM 12091]